jgi:hypothetical protein
VGKYIGFKLIDATPMNLIDAEEKLQRKIKPGNEPGYLVKYPEGYESWSPKDVFEKAYMQVGDNNTITQVNVDSFINEINVVTLGEKTTVVRATLVNGFEIIESSSCVDPANYDEKLGEEICKERIKNQVWNHLGFLLQTAWKGIK